MTSNKPDAKHLIPNGIPVGFRTHYVVVDKHGNIGGGSREFLQGRMDKFLVWVPHDRSIEAQYRVLEQGSPTDGRVERPLAGAWPAAGNDWNGRTADA